MNKKRGFTLVELLVVIAIIALLMSILMPALAQVRKAAKEAACGMHLRQLGICWQMYTGDNNGFFTDGRRGTEEAGIGDWLCELDGGYKHENPKTPAEIDESRDAHRALSYIKNYNILICPMATSPLPDVPVKYKAWGGGPLPLEDMGVLGNRYLPYNASGVGSYAHNAWCNNSPKEVPLRFSTIYTKYNWKTTAVAGGSDIPVNIDSFRWACVPRASDDCPKYDGEGGGENGTNEMKRVCLDRHNAAVDVLFMDWSVRRTGLKELWELKWHRNWSNELEEAGGMPAWERWMSSF
jgi:prepilin-type N-terminal cleavage/methylation domain-containing protein